MTIKKTNKRPWHVWVFGVLFICLYGIGIYDIFMMLGHNEAYYNLNGFSDETLAYFTDYHNAMTALWIVNLASGFVAPIFLILRFRIAVHLSLIAALSILLQQIITFGFMGRFDALGTAVSIFDVFILLITWSFYFYSKSILSDET